MTDMPADHARDYKQKDRIDTLRTVIRDFLDEPPSRVRESTLEALRAADADLSAVSAYVVALWN